MRQDMTQQRAERLALRASTQQFANEWPDWVELDTTPKAMRREQLAAKARYEAERFIEQRING